MRRHYVVSYDIANDKRRNEVFGTLKGFGNHAQYSVFFCELDQKEFVRLRRQLRDAIHERQDQVMILDIGPSNRDFEECLQVIGKPYDPPTRVVVV